VGAVVVCTKGVRAVVGTTGIRAVVVTMGHGRRGGRCGLQRAVAGAHLTQLHAHAMALETARGQLRRGRAAQHGAGRARIGAAHHGAAQHGAAVARGLGLRIERRIERLGPREGLRSPSERRLERDPALVVVPLLLGVPAGSGRT
jgi:hypothetical protein